MERKNGAMACNLFNELRLEKELCDVLFKVNSDEFHAHKIILCGCSPYFRALFTHGCHPPDKVQYIIPGISSEIMELIMEYAYIQQVNITEENVHELLITADYLAMSGLVNKCSMFLKAQVCQENCIGIWRFARFCFCMKLEQQALQFILHHFEEVLHGSEEFLNLTVEELCEIMEKNELNVKQENLVFEAIILWIEHAPLERKTHIGLLLARVRMGLLPYDYFMDNIRNNNLVANDTVCRRIIYSILLNMYDLKTDKFLSSDLTLPRLPSAILLAVGGWSHEGPTNAIEAYDPRADCWVNVTCCGESPRAYQGVVYLNGFVYCMGGYEGRNYINSMHRFDPITRTWAEVGPMHCCRCYVSVCVLDNYIYAMGGFDGTERLNTAERYNPENNQWSMIAPMHERRSDASATVLNGKVFICGGFDGNACSFTAEYYNSLMDQWTLLPRMTSRRSGLGVVNYRGQVYAVGGFDGVNILRTAEKYNPQINSWGNVAEMITRRSNFGIEVLDDLLFVVGGHHGISTANNVEYYDGETAGWYEVEDMAVFRSALSCCVLSGLPNMAEYAAPRDPQCPEIPERMKGSITDPDNIWN